MENHIPNIIDFKWGLNIKVSLGGTYANNGEQLPHELIVLRKWLEGIVNGTGSIWDLEYVLESFLNWSSIHTNSVNILHQYIAPRYTGNLHTCAKGKRLFSPSKQNVQGPPTIDGGPCHNGDSTLCLDGLVLNHILIFEVLQNRFFCLFTLHPHTEFKSHQISVQKNQNCAQTIICPQAYYLGK